MLKILYICTHNRCRSILCEALTNHLGEGRLVAKSAGSEPADAIHPLTLAHLEQQNIPTADLKSQGWHEFEMFAPDLIVTVCDSAAAEVCPAYFGKGVKVHWGLADPSKVTGSEADIDEAFDACLIEIKSRIPALLNLEQDWRAGESLELSAQQMVANTQ